MRGWIFVAAALLVSAALVGYTFSAVPALSGFAAGLFKAALAVGAFWAFDRFVLTELDTVEELRAGNVAYGLMLVALALLLAATVATACPAPAGAQPVEGLDDGRMGRWEETRDVPVHVRIARSYVGTVEEGANRGAVVERFQRAVGIPPGSAWCAAFVGFVLGEAERESGRRVVPAVRSGVAMRYISRESIRARDVLRGVARPPVGSLVVWRRGATWRGHVGFVLRDDNAAVRGEAWTLRCGRTVEGNTSSGTGGSQADGDGVWERVRCILPGAYFRIVAFTPVRYAEGPSP